MMLSLSTGNIGQVTSAWNIGHWRGFYKRGCQEKTLLPSLEPRYFSDIQPLSPAPVPAVRSSSVVSSLRYDILR